MTVETADMIPNGWKHWLALGESAVEWQDRGDDETEMVRLGAGRNLGFMIMVARRREARWLG